MTSVEIVGNKKRQLVIKSDKVEQPLKFDVPAASKEFEEIERLVIDRK